MLHVIVGAVMPGEASEVSEVAESHTSSSDSGSSQNSKKEPENMNTRMYGYCSEDIH